MSSTLRRTRPRSTALLRPSFSEAERLETALADLEARGVPGVERIRTAAAEHRRLAAEAAERGNAYDRPLTAVSDAPSVPTGVDPTEPEPHRPVTKPPPIHDDLRDFSDDIGAGAAGPPTVESEPVAASTPELDIAVEEDAVASAVVMEEIEMPAIDLAADSEFAAPPAQDEAFGVADFDGDVST